MLFSNAVSRKLKPVNLGLSCLKEWRLSYGASFRAGYRVSAFKNFRAMCDDGPFQLAVCGLHLSGQPLNWQLIEVQGRLLQTCKSSPDYKLYAIEGPSPGLVRPGMIYVTDGSGTAIDLEVWEVPATAIGGLLRRVARPLGFGTVLLEDGSKTFGFICEG
eukprot:jgi/Botrbrau1/17320/Bobra.0015s0068.1